MNWETFAHDADVGVRGRGATAAEAFAGAALAMTSAICAPERIVARASVSVECTAGNMEMLLVDWLNALIYEMATRHILFSRFEVNIEGPLSASGQEVGSLCLRATAWGEPVDVGRHHPAAEVKGASYCELAVRQDADGLWIAQCIVDV